MVERRDSRAEFLFDAFEQEERVALVALRAITAQVDGDDAPGNMPGVDIPDLVFAEYVQHASLPVGVLDWPKAADPVWAAEVLAGGPGSGPWRT